MDSQGKKHTTHLPLRAFLYAICKGLVETSILSIYSGEVCVCQPRGSFNTGFWSPSLVNIVNFVVHLFDILYLYILCIGGIFLSPYWHISLCFPRLSAMCLGPKA